MTARQRQCILCSFVPPPPLTKEHIWPVWYSELRPSTRYAVESIPNQDTEPTYRQAVSLDFAPGVLCDDCNHVWGSALETRVRQHIEPMSAGEGRVLSVLAMRHLSAWDCLKAMVAEFLILSESDPFFKQSEREHLRTTGAPPRCVAAIWIGRYVGERHDAGWLFAQRLPLPFSDDPPSVADMYVETFAIGQVVFQLLAFHAGALSEDFVGEATGFFPVAKGDWSAALHRIWPLPEDPVRWPPTRAFDDEAFLALARRWNQHDPTWQAHDNPPPHMAA